jgi:hypothetical protein
VIGSSHEQQISSQQTEPGRPVHHNRFAIFNPRANRVIE